MYFHDFNGNASKKLGRKIYDPMQWQKQAGNITTKIQVEVNFTLPLIRKRSDMTWKCYVDDSSKGGYDMILGRDILT